MRYLSKVVFINSAHIPYSEIRLDGNVHFIGTQGVGKSTLLRALLFFYNADKQHLGIQQGQKSFDEFYFAHANSYIVYEVEREFGAYTILVSRHQGRATFRFIDAPYQRDWFINDRNEVQSDWVKIRTNITKERNIEITPRIETYETYRDVIFGNTHDRSHKFDKYALVESSKYQNIPRSIQNVFLNSKLDAEFVKNTIIQSMTDEEVAIELSVYRTLVANFEKEYEEISCWFKKEKNGEVIVRRHAEQVVNVYRETIAFEQQIRQAIHQLNYAVGQANSQLPILQEELKKTQEDLQKEQKRKNECQQKFDSEKSLLLRKLGEKEGDIKKLTEKKKKYSEMNIADILHLHRSEPQLQQEKKRQENILSALTKHFEDITTKYAALFGALDNKHAAFQNAQETELNHLKEEIHQKLEGFQQERDILLKESDERYNEQSQAFDEQFETLQNEKNVIERRIQELKTWHPFAAETESLENELHQLDVEEAKASADLKTLESQKEQLRAEAQRDSETKAYDYELERRRLNDQLQQAKEEIRKTESLLSKYKGSFYEWLTQNDERWKENIGKLVDEEQVLYSQNLNPQLVSYSDSLYGVQVDLEKLETQHRTPDEYRAHLKELQDSSSDLTKQLNALQQDKDQTEKKISERLSEKLRPLNQQIAELKVLLGQIPTKRRDKRTQLDGFEKQEEEKRKVETDKKQKELNEIIVRIDKTKQSKKGAYALNEKEKNKVRSDFRQKEKELKKLLDELRQKQEIELNNEVGDYTRQKQEYERQREQELQGKGADTSKIIELENSIKQLEEKLKKIDSNRSVVFNYLKDKEELFDKEETIRHDKKVLEQKIDNLQNQYDERIRKMNQAVSELDRQVRLKQEAIRQLKDGLQKYDELINIEHILTEEYLKDDKQKENRHSIQQLITELRGAINDKKRKQEDLKRAVLAFNGRFRPDNIFHFNTQPITDTDYIDIALNLQEFLDNNKIEDYRNRSNEHYQHILQRISGEVGGLMNYQSQIETIIYDINRDFVEKNFAGVIKSIELRAEQSSDSMMRLLIGIKNFIEDNALNIGETNLFSDDNKDQVNRKVVDYLVRFMKQLQSDHNKARLTLSDTFNLQFRVKENDNSTGWVPRINNVGSDGTDILVKAMINIMLINVFKNKAAHRRNQDFIIHCMMDEIGKLHPNNVRGILQFASSRNIYLISSSPTTNNAYDFKYIYLLEKDSRSMTKVKRLLTNNSATI